MTGFWKLARDRFLNHCAVLALYHSSISDEDGEQAPPQMMWPHNHVIRTSPDTEIFHESLLLNPLCGSSSFIAHFTYRLLLFISSSSTLQKLGLLHIQTLSSMQGNFALDLLPIVVFMSHIENVTQLFLQLFHNNQLPAALCKSVSMKWSQESDDSLKA